MNPSAPVSAGAAPTGVICSPKVSASTLTPVPSVSVIGTLNAAPGAADAAPPAMEFGDATDTTVESVALAEPIAPPPATLT